jgi:hypothetical protein
MEADVTDAIALSMRTGIISTFPEVRRCLLDVTSVIMHGTCLTCACALLDLSPLQPALDLLSAEEMHTLLTGGSGCSPASGLALQRIATYEHPVSACDPHVQVRAVTVP